MKTDIKLIGEAYSKIRNKGIINIRNYSATSEESSLGGYRPKVVNTEDGSVLYLSQKSYSTPVEAKIKAEEYLMQYASGVPSLKIKI
jgi:hypothetical protein